MVWHVVHVHFMYKVVRGLLRIFPLDSVYTWELWVRCVHTYSVVSNFFEACRSKELLIFWSRRVDFWAEATGGWRRRIVKCRHHGINVWGLLGCFIVCGDDKRGGGIRRRGSVDTRQFEKRLRAATTYLGLALRNKRRNHRRLAACHDILGLTLGYFVSSFLG